MRAANQVLCNNTEVQNSRDFASPNRQSFKLIDLRENPQQVKSNIHSPAHAKSPKVTRDLYRTGFMFKNNNSPYANDFRLSSDFKIKPNEPHLLH